MSVVGIDHINITATMPTLERCVRFYADVLGLTPGLRPPFKTRGFWLYAGDAPIVHLTEAGTDAPVADGPLNHIALACRGAEAMEETLRRLEIPYTVARVPARNQVQIFVRDPAGVRLELNFNNA